MEEKIICAGFGGQGVMLLGQLIAYGGNEMDLHSLWFPSYGPETRGGTANCSVTISEKPVNSPVISKADSIIVMNKPSLMKFESRVRSGGTLYINSSLVEDRVKRDDIHVFYIPANDLAMEMGNVRVANMIILGAYLEYTKLIPIEIIHHLLEKTFQDKNPSIIALNFQALEKGKEFVKAYQN